MLSLLLSGVAHAQESQAEHCTQTRHAWIAIDTPAAAADDPVAWPEVVRHIGSELLALRDVELCAVPKSFPPLATLRLERKSPTVVRITLSAPEPEQLVGERTFDLGSVPADARLLSLAITADELLAANFAELERRAQLRARPKPAPVAPPPSPPPREPRVELGVAFMGDGYGWSDGMLGIDARAAVLAGRFAAGARLGRRLGFSTRAEHGTVSTSALVFGAEARFDTLGGQRLKLDLLGRLDAVSVEATGYPFESSTQATTQSALAVVASGGLALRGALSRSLQLLLEGSVGGAVRPVSFTDTGRDAAGISGAVLSGGGGVLVVF